MIWLLVCAGGLIAETSLIVVLGRQVTGAFPTLDPVAEQPGRRQLGAAAAGGSDMDE